MARLSEIGTPLSREQLLGSYPFRVVAQRETFLRGLRRAGVNV
jgi:hypothetical protein